MDRIIHKDSIVINFEIIAIGFAAGLAVPHHIVMKKYLLTILIASQTNAIDIVQPIVMKTRPGTLPAQWDVQCRYVGTVQTNIEDVIILGRARTLTEKVNTYTAAVKNGAMGYVVSFLRVVLPAFTFGFRPCVILIVKEFSMIIMKGNIGVIVPAVAAALRDDTVFDSIAAPPQEK